MWLIIVLLARILWQQWQLWPRSSFEFVVCDVGQGDALLLTFGYAQVLVDTGPDEKILACLSENLPIWDKKIDVLVLTHFDADHLGGFSHLVQKYWVGYVFLPLYQTQESDLFLEAKALLVAMQSVGTELKQPFLGQQIDLLDFSQEHQTKYNSIARATITFLTPTSLSSSQSAVLEGNGLFFGQKSETNLSAATWETMGSEESNNNGSIVLLFQFDQFSAVLTGDLEEPGELALMAKGLITRVNILKVGHHGSKTSSSLRFLQLIKPEVSLISAGKNNKFGHPHIEILERLREIGSQIWRTDQQADFIIRSDGQKFYLIQKNQ